MQYISVGEASKKWDVSLRQVQRLLAGGRIPHAIKLGRSWMIPSDAEKPGDPRRGKAQYSLDADLAGMIAATLVPMPEGNPDAILDTLDEDRLRLHYEGELAYLRGDFGRVMACYARTEGDDAARLRACSVTIAAAISLGDYEAYAGIESWLKALIAKEKGSVSASVAELALAVAAVSAIAPNMAPEWLKAGDFSAIPIGARPDAAYKRAKYFICLGNFEAALAIAQTALSFCGAEHKVAYADINLRIVCAFSNYALKRPEEAKRFLLSAMKTALPYGFITPFAEMATAFGGLLETLLKLEAPEQYKTVTEQWERVFKNWLKIHNRFTQDNITLMLTRREYELALLVTRHVPYAQIAKQHSISVSRLKSIMEVVYGKLLINKRNELAKFIL